MLSTPQSMQVYLQTSFSSLLWHTSITRKMCQKRMQRRESEDARPKGNCQLQILSFDPDAVFSATQVKFFEKLDWKHYKSLLNLGFKNKVDEKPLFIEEAIKRYDRGRKVSAVTKGWIQPFVIFFPRKDPFMLWSKLFTLMETSETRWSQQWNWKVGPCYAARQGTHLVLAAGWSYMVRSGLPSQLRGSGQRSVILAEGGH